MSLAALARAGLLALLVAVVGAAAAPGALVEVNNLVLRADGGFRPQSLPKRSYAPIEFHGRIDISSKDGFPVPALRQALIDFDRDGRLTVAGLPTCAPESVAQASSAEARRTCRGAIVGRGEIEILIQVLEAGSQYETAPLTIFNGPRLGRLPTAILHARLAGQTHAIVVPIEKRRGDFRYRARLDVPPLAGGWGRITHLDVEIGRRYRAGGEPRSYVSARCSDNVLQTHGRFSFEDGTIIDGLVEKYCHQKQ